ncbi:MAG TPA: cytochrome c maturation protein CcmE [Stellaceae bacterium]|nr:cytochrome c maturation protein CcmE [Stellaceae bacterium]
MTSRKRRRRRLAIALVGLAALGGATALVLAAFRDNLVFFFSPSELIAKPDLADRRIRIGGLVESHSLAHEDGRRVTFRITDGRTDIDVSYDGILPDLFREGQGVVAEGRVKGGVFVASTILAKHDEKYMPPEVAKALKESGHWQESGDASALAGPPPAHFR